MRAHKNKKTPRSTIRESRCHGTSAVSRPASLQCTLLLLAATTAAPLQATSLSDVAASLQPGQWAELTTANFNAATLDDGGAYSVFWYAEDIAWDAARRQLLYVGGGHGSDAEFLAYDEATNTWSVRKPGGGIPWDTYFSEAYDHIALVPSLDRLYFRQPAFDQSDRIEIYDISSGTWSRSPLMPARPACCGALEYFAELGGLVQLGGPGSIFFYDTTTDLWSTLSSGVAVGDYHNFAEYSPVHRVMIFGGGEGANGAALFRMDAARQITRLNDAPQRMGTTYSIVTTDPVSGDFLVFFDGASYELDPMTQVWTPLAAVPPWRSLGAPGVFNAVATPIPTHGVILVAKYAGDNSRVYLYRHTAATAPAPTLTFNANPPSVAAGGFSVLTWTSNDATLCTGASGSGAWPGSKGVPNGSENVGPILSPTTFSLSCSGPGGAVQRAVTVDVQASPPAAPTLTLTASPASIASGGSTQLSWSSTNATSCTASGGWTGARLTSGNETVGSLTATSTFTLRCSGAGGSISQSAAVTVAAGGGAGGGGTSSGGGGSLGWLGLLGLLGIPAARRLFNRAA